MMKKGLKTMVGMFMLAMLWGGVSTMSAQKLLVNLNDESSVEVNLDSEFTMSLSDGNVVFSNADGKVEFAESSIVNVTYDELYGDVNRDGVVNVADICLIINLMAGYSVDDKEPSNAEPVDLALPSNKKWANINIGAYEEDDFGSYFAWGETRGYSNYAKDGRSFNWEEYKWMTEGKDSWEYINKYQYYDHQNGVCWYDENGTFIGDGHLSLLPEDDAARAAWGKKWRMPTMYEVMELIQNTQQDWVKIGKVWGCKFTGSNGNYIFLPAAGLREDEYVYYRDDLLDLGSGIYWTADGYEHQSSNATALSLQKVEGLGRDAIVGISYQSRQLGLSVRAILVE